MEKVITGDFLFNAVNKIMDQALTYTDQSLGVQLLISRHLILAFFQTKAGNLINQVAIPPSPLSVMGVFHLPVERNSLWDLVG